MADSYALALGAKLRAIRTQQGLSLQGVEDKSNGAWKAVVVGSYERGDRAVTTQRLAELADFYGVPITALLPDAANVSAATTPPKLILNLERIAELNSAEMAPLSRYVANIQGQRGDYNGKILSIRTEDLRSLAVILDKTPAQVTEQLIELKILNPEARNTMQAEGDL
ncbi:transcriptional regulator [Micrococcales bacterium 31B]|nr:transcriptional regulator [Micrococcales bacterium 31B]